VCIAPPTGRFGLLQPAQAPPARAAGGRPKRSASAGTTATRRRRIIAGAGSSQARARRHGGKHGTMKRSRRRRAVNRSESAAPREKSACVAAVRCEDGGEMAAEQDTLREARRRAALRATKVTALVLAGLVLVPVV